VCEQLLRGSGGLARRIGERDRAGAILLDPRSRHAYDEELENEPDDEEAVFSPSFPWRPYVCALLAVPVVLSAFIIVLAVIASRSALTNASDLRSEILSPLLVGTAAALPCGLIVLVIAARARRALRSLTMPGVSEVVDPAEQATIDSLSRMSEFTAAATRATWIGLIVIALVWVWFGALHLGISL
jgi:hypothetical protein